MPNWEGYFLVSSRQSAGSSSVGSTMIWQLMFEMGPNKIIPGHIQLQSWRWPGCFGSSHNVQVSGEKVERIGKYWKGLEKKLKINGLLAPKLPHDSIGGIEATCQDPPTPPWRWRHAYWGANSHTKCSIPFVNIAVAISALAGGAT